jgi:B12-binding domain/radical SAM domain protein
VAKTDLVLLHAPSVYDFRENSIMYGPVSDLVPSTPIFEMYPIGFSTIGEYMERHGLSVRIVNLAFLMLRDPDFDVEKAIAKLDPAAFGIDLHWLPHAHGALEIARLVKKHHPTTPVMLGGLSSSYFYEELITYPQVDFVVRGDSTEEPIRQLLETLKGRGSLADVPNLVWKDSTGAVRENPFTSILSDLSSVSLNYSFNMRSVIKYRDLLGFVPFKNWLSYPITAALTCRGCTHDCVTCGGSAYAFKNSYGRSKPAYRDPVQLANDIGHVQKYIPGPVFILGDIRQPGEDYADAFLSALKRQKLKNQIAMEFFVPPEEEFYAKLSDALPHYSIEMSIESHDDEVRRAFGKGYTTKRVEESVKAALAHGCERVDIYFMTGLPKQTSQSVLDTVDYSSHLYREVAGDPRVLVFTSPMAPFLDPGSRVFDNPEKYGYRLKARTLEEHRQLLTQPSWKYIMNYETEWMSADEQVEATYEAGLGLNRVKAEIGAIDELTARRTADRIERARQVMASIDGIMHGDPRERGRRLAQLEQSVRTVNESTVCEKSELEWSAKAFTSHFFAVAALWLKTVLSQLIPMRQRYDRGPA